jgi:pilus assembly protein CpaC
MWRVVILALCVFAANQAPAAEPPSPYAGAVPNAPTSTNYIQPPPVAAIFNQDATVLLKVSIIEVSLTKLRRQGDDFEKLLADNLPGTSAGKKKPAEKDIELFAESLPTSSGCFLLKEDDKFFALVKKLVKSDMAKILAQPILVTSNGRVASYNCGGEVPVPVPQSAGMTTIEWKKFGTQVAFNPVVLDQDTIKLEIRTTITRLDESRSVNIGGTSIPGMVVLTDMETSFKIKTGQVAVVSGERRSRAVPESASPAEKKNPGKADAATDSASETSEEFALLLLIKPKIGEPEK